MGLLWVYLGSNSLTVVPVIGHLHEDLAPLGEKPVHRYGTLLVGRSHLLRWEGIGENSVETEKETWGGRKMRECTRGNDGTYRDEGRGAKGDEKVA